MLVLSNPRVPFFDPKVGSLKSLPRYNSLQLSQWLFFFIVSFHKLHHWASQCLQIRARNGFQTTLWLNWRKRLRKLNSWITFEKTVRRSTTDSTRTSFTRTIQKLRAAETEHFRHLSTHEAAIRTRTLLIPTSKTTLITNSSRAHFVCFEHLNCVLSW